MLLAQKLSTFFAWKSRVLSPRRSIFFHFFPRRNRYSIFAIFPFNATTRTRNIYRAKTGTVISKKFRSKGKGNVNLPLVLQSTKFLTTVFRVTLFQPSQLETISTGQPPRPTNETTTNRYWRWHSQLPTARCRCRVKKKKWPRVCNWRARDVPYSRHAPPEPTPIKC